MVWNPFLLYIQNWFNGFLNVLFLMLNIFILLHTFLMVQDKMGELTHDKGQGFLLLLEISSESNRYSPALLQMELHNMLAKYHGLIVNMCHGLNN